MHTTHNILRSTYAIRRFTAIVYAELFIKAKEGEELLLTQPRVLWRGLEPGIGCRHVAARWRVGLGERHIVGDGGFEEKAKDERETKPYRQTWPQGAGTGGSESVRRRARRRSWREVS